MNSDLTVGSLKFSNTDVNKPIKIGSNVEYKKGTKTDLELLKKTFDIIGVKYDVSDNSEFTELEVAEQLSFYFKIDGKFDEII